MRQSSFDARVINGPSGAIGSALPFVALQLGHDPAVVVSPLMTTLTDMLGTLTFLGLASMIIAIFT